MDVISKTKNYEKRFQRNKYNGIDKVSYEIKKGSIPIMVSAPHAVNHYRDGKVKLADQYTGGIAYYLHKKCGCHLIYSSAFNESDPNYDDIHECTYKKELGNYVKDNDIKFLIDLHGSKTEREFAIEMGTINEENSSLRGKNFLENLVKMVFEDELGEYLKVDKKTILKNKVFAASNPNTVTHYISQEIEIPAMQIEINKLYRNPDNSERFLGMIIALERIICIAGTADWTADEILILRAKTSSEHFPQDKVELNNNASNEIRESDMIYIKTEHNFQTIGKVTKNDKCETGYACLTNRLIERLFQGKNCEKELLLIYRYGATFAYSVGRPMANVSNICFSPDIYETLDKNKKYILHPYGKENGCKMYVIPKEYPRGEKKIYIPRYYRLLMGIDDGEINNIKVQVLPGIHRDKRRGLNLCLLLRNLRNYLLNFFIGYTEIDMKVWTPNNADDQNLIGRLSGDMMKVLGVTDNDVISVVFGEKEKNLKALEGKVRTKTDKNEVFYDMYVGLPAAIRSELDVMPGDIIKVKRNMKHIFIRNFNQQLFAVLGTILTLITLTDEIKLRVIGAMIVIPFVVWITFAEERVKIGKKKK